MFRLLSRSIHTATRLDPWDAPDHWRNQQADYRARRTREEVDRARLRRGAAATGPRRGTL